MSIKILKNSLVLLPMHKSLKINKRKEKKKERILKKKKKTLALSVDI